MATNDTTTSHDDDRTDGATETRIDAHDRSCGGPAMSSAEVAALVLEMID